MTIFYFTATGNSLAVAKQIGGSLVSIPQVIDSDNLHFKDSIIGLVFPIYWWDLPFMVRRFIEKATFDADYLFAIGTYGSLPGAAMVSLQNRAKAKGYSFSYTNQIKMLDNYLPNYDMGKQMETLPKKRVPEQVTEIIADIENRRTMTVGANIGKRAMTGLFRRIFKPEKNASMYTVNEKCNHCGVCAQVCLAGNIKVSEKVEFDEKCEGCLACLHLCPKVAIHWKNEINDIRWRNPDVSLNEIIQANNKKAASPSKHASKS